MNPFPVLRRELATPFEQTLGRLPEALAAQGFGVLTQIDVAATLEAKLGLKRRPYRILGACNPRYAARALEEVPEVGVLLPCNVVLSEREDGGTTVLAVDPSATLAAHVPALAPLAGEVRDALARALESL